MKNINSTQKDTITVSVIISQQENLALENFLSETAGSKGPYIRRLLQKDLLQKGYLKLIDSTESNQQ